MVYKLFITTALATLLATGAYPGNVVSDAQAAQGTTAATTKAVPEGSLISKIMGAAVYNGTDNNAEEIGEVNDIVISKDGKAQLLVIGVGGFLGVGEKNVAYDFNKAQWAEKNGKRWLVINTTKDDLKAQPDFDTKPYDALASTGSNETTASTASANSNAAVDKTALTEMPIDKIRAEDLVGTTVYGADDANVGKIGDVVLTGDKKVDAVIIDVGGFLGIGAKEVAVGFDKLKFMTDKAGNKYLYTNFTKDQLTAQTAYDKGTYAQTRDKQRLIVN
jgi:sporulation protein YlmC with PRC-barrel domain